MELNKQDFSSSSIAFLQLLSFAMVWMVCTTIGSGGLMVYIQASGWTSMASAFEQVLTTKNSDTINQLRYIQILGHLSNYFFPAVLFVFLWHRRQAWNMLLLDKLPQLKKLLPCLLALLALFPFISWVYYWNITLIPKEWIGYDKLKMQAIFMSMNSGYELGLNIFLLGIVAAVGEELLFRGILQPILKTLTHNEHRGAFITAILFSLIHFQWEGFVARFLLGLLLCYLLIWTKNLWIPIIAHFFFNTIQVIKFYFNPLDFGQIQAPIEVPFLFAVGSLIVSSFIFYKYLIKE